jgi:hypothetical protein
MVRETVAIDTFAIAATARISGVLSTGFRVALLATSDPANRNKETLQQCADCGEMLKPVPGQEERRSMTAFGC